MGKKKFIRKAIKHPGALRRWAEQHHFIKAGKIDLKRAHGYATKHHEPHRLRQIHLAATLRKLSFKGCGNDCPKG